jgi:chromosome segregation ATPase
MAFKDMTGLPPAERSALLAEGVIDVGGWPADKRAELERAEAELRHEEQRLAALAEEQRAAKESPDAVIAARVEELRKAREKRQAAEREAEEEAIYKALCLKHGEKRVARVRTHDGSVMFHASSPKEIDALAARVRGLKTDADREKAGQSALRATVDHPSPREFDDRVAKYPGLWPYLYLARDAIESGLAEETEKKD